MNRNYFRLIRSITNASTAWHIQQASAIGMMPLVFSLISGDMRTLMQEEQIEMKGISDEGQKLLNRYNSLSPEPFVSERETWLYDSFPVKMGEVLMMPIVGAISQEDYCGTAGSQTIMGWYQKAASDPSIKAIIEVKNSPGGEVFGTRALADLKMKIQKPKIGFTQGLEASACLYIGATDDYKFASSNDCLIGSCGVMTTFQNWSAWYQEKGIVVTDLYSKDSPLKNDSYRKAMKGDFKGYTDGILFKFDQSFMSFMQTHRTSISQEALQGAEFLSEDAIQAGLIDQIGSFDEAYQFALEAIKSPSILQKSNKTMEQKTVKMSAFLAGIATALGAKLVNDDGTEIKGDNSNSTETNTNEDGAGESEGSEETHEAPTAETTTTPTADTAPGTPTATAPTADKDAEIDKLKAEANQWKAQALKGKATTAVQKTTDDTVLNAKNIYAGLTNFED